MISGIIFNIVAFVFVLGILVFVHEFGHFIMAKLNKVYVEKFSLGLGPKIVGIKKGETEYVISAIPLGGFVKLKGENPDEELSGAPDELYSKGILQRLSIFAAGPLMNIFLAVAAISVVNIIGVEVPSYLKDKPEIAGVMEKSPADEAGFKRGDLITAIGDKKIDTWEEAELQLSLTAAETQVSVLRAGEKQTLDFKPYPDPESAVSMGGILAPLDVVIQDVSGDSPASAAGLQAGDYIVAVNDQEIHTTSQFLLLISENGGNSLTMRIEREGEILEKDVKPEFNQTEERWLIGITFTETAKDYYLKSYGFFGAIKQGVNQTLNMSRAIYELIWQLLTGKASVKNLGGPILIAQFAGRAAKHGLISLISFIGFISINLGILNLLPIPILDGGHILFLIPEVFTGKPVSMKKRMIAQQIGFGILVLLIIIIFYNDIMRIT